MSKHTPGPWWMSTSFEILKMPEQIKISNGISGVNLEQAKANAHLVSAAPELLDALIWLRDCIDQNMPEQTSSPAMVATRKAIKKAQGE